LLVAIFAVPILVAWLYAAGVLQVRDRGLVNRGQLLEPPIDLSSDDLTRRLLSRAGLAPGEWSVLYLRVGPCGLPCAEDLDELLAIRAVLGRDGERIRVLGLIDGERPATGRSRRHGERIIVDGALYANVTAAIRSRDGSATFPAIALFDWRGQMVMQYPHHAPPKDIKSDLKRLLKASRLR
jgi:hypothetical protein